MPRWGVASLVFAVIPPTILLSSSSVFVSSTGGVLSPSFQKAITAMNYPRQGNHHLHPRGVCLSSTSQRNEINGGGRGTDHPSTTHKNTDTSDPIDTRYPGTAVTRMNRIRELAQQASLTGDWPDIRRKLLHIGGLRDLPYARPGMGYTGHAFNDWNHCDLTAMRLAVSSYENQGKVQGIARGNQLGKGILAASLPEHGPGGSWSTCLMGCNQNPPADVAHLQ